MDGFNLNDAVFYPFHGICTIGGTEKQKITGTEVDCVILHFAKGNISMCVPVSAWQDIGIRQVSTRETVTNIINFINDGTVDAENDDWTTRYAENQSKLKSGTIYNIADVFKKLKKRNMEKNLSAADRKMLKSALRMLTDEIAYVLGIDESDAEKMINR